MEFKPRVELNLVFHGPSLKAEALSSVNKNRELCPQAHQDKRQLTAKVGSTYRPGTQRSPVVSLSSEAANTQPSHRSLERMLTRMRLTGLQGPSALSPALTAPEQPPSLCGEWAEIIDIRRTLSSLHIWMHITRLFSRKL